jgi:YggT family protein
VCAVDWGVRTRRLSPFGGIARFFRARIDPLMLPIERRIVNSGGLPASAPLWALGVIVVGGILLIALLRFFGGLLSSVLYAVQDPSPRGLPKLVLSWAFGALRLALMVRVISSWIGAMRFSKWVRWSYPLTDWMLAPLRRVIPLIGMVDITPIVAWFLLGLLQNLLQSLL